MLYFCQIPWIKAGSLCFTYWFFALKSTAVVCIDKIKNKQTNKKICVTIQKLRDQTIVYLLLYLLTSLEETWKWFFPLLLQASGFYFNYLHKNVCVVLLMMNNSDKKNKILTWCSSQNLGKRANTRGHSATTTSLDVSVFSASACNRRGMRGTQETGWRWIRLSPLWLS